MANSADDLHLGSDLDDPASAMLLSFFERLELAKADCALVFERRGGKLTDRDVMGVVEHWTISPREDIHRLDLDLLAGHLFSWLG
jgi:hypothetical protein